ncbi:AMP-binding protein [Cryobacterium breve]|uniref:AMP-binding protein n=1 Tax=Cryobacterium breve TaxID=1259258 RepID=UPI003D7C1E87
MRQGYGMSELSPISHAMPRGRDDIPHGVVGLALPNIECKLVDPETGRDIVIPDVGVSEPGELLVRGPNVMLGYLGNEQATREILEADGFLHTGDVATVSAEGYVTIIDRLKEPDQVQGLPGRARRTRGTVAQPPGDRRRRGRRRTGCRRPGGAEGFRRRASRPGAPAGGRDGLHRRAGGAAQEGAAGGVHRRHSQVHLRQDPAQGPARARPHAVSVCGVLGVRPARRDCPPAAVRRPPVGRRI